MRFLRLASDYLLVSLEETIIARGHPNIIGMHASTLEVTKEEHLTRNGDCIIAVGASKGARDLPKEIRDLIRKEGSKVALTLNAESIEEVVFGEGSPRLNFQDSQCMVFRKSGYICGRTVMIHANKAARSLDRTLISLMTQVNTRVVLKLEVTA